MNPLILIPARLAATRLPNKPLADIMGKPMIVRAYEQAKMSGYRVAVAAGDPEIVEVVTAAGGEAVLTDPALPSGSDRIRVAADLLDPSGEHDTLINVQGDMPFASPKLAQLCVELMQEQPSCDIATLVGLATPEEYANPDVVKAVLALDASGQKGRALYFTRSHLYGEGPTWHHVGIYGYRREALNRFCAAEPSPLEKREKLEQLRALEMGMQIWAAAIDAAPISVDNAEDLEAARAYAASL
ncbi:MULTISPECIES: 3-deoxy-manno-octulosonate cytidylyltransferase [unclassified Brevundimonas]|uniref:3-deoxy-manno-octulosonate cytidylyltransferase n=1 Tax=unclassified Brevundimonas TaxID=2622653 RepID=UPI0025B968C2|nr:MULTISPECIES: 3-deoxy-manno-octulosonate cytidylyltransferase [unclassified Brevundimonas]